MSRTFLLFFIRVIRVIRGHTPFWIMNFNKSATRQL